MKERIVVEYSEVGKIAGLLGCSREMASITFYTPFMKR